MIEKINELISYAEKFGYKFPNTIPLDGKTFTRFPHSGKKDGWVVGIIHELPGKQIIVATFGSWVSGDHETFSSFEKLNASEKKSIEQAKLKLISKAEVERQKIQEQVSIESEKIFNDDCVKSATAPYLQNKKLSHIYSCKTVMGPEGRDLAVPCYDIVGRLWGIQYIDSKNNKLFTSGQRVKSTFHVIPDFNSLAESDVVYICEGFATAATVHEATGKTTVTAFNSGNLKPVAQAIKQKYQEKSIIICGDDDYLTDGNPGKKAAEDAAAAVMGKAIFPKFKNRSSTPKKTDFNDLYVYESLETVTDQILNIKPEFHAIRCLGYNENTYYFISSYKPTVIKISAGSFSDQMLMGLMPIQYWESNYPSRDGIDWKSAYSALIGGCSQVGVFKPENIRGLGVWRDRDDIVFNTGAFLIVNGELKSYFEYKTKYIYENSSRVIIPDDECLSEDTVQSLDSILNKLSWSDPSSSKLLLGWIFIAPFCGALSWRPHLWLTGPTGAGKSTIMDIVDKTIGQITEKCIGGTTESGIRQTLKSNAIPLWFDEAETDDSRSSDRISGVVELFRQASSENSAAVRKGTAHGNSISFNVKFAGIVSAIRPNLEHAQDRNRFASLDLNESSANNFYGPKGIQSQLNKLFSDAKFSDKFIARCIKQYPTFVSNLNTIRSIMLQKHKARSVDQYGTLLAGYFSAIDDKPLTQEYATWAVNEFVNVDNQVSQSAGDKDENECLEHIMGQLVKDKDNKPHKVSDLVYSNIEKTIPVQSDVEILELYGMTISKDKQFIVKPTDAQIKKIMRGTKWSKSLKKVLLRIKGAKVKTHRVNKIVSDCVIIPVIKTVITENFD